MEFIDITIDITFPECNNYNDDRVTLLKEYITHNFENFVSIGINRSNYSFRFYDKKLLKELTDILCDIGVNIAVKTSTT